MYDLRVNRIGFEPMTPSLEGLCSIQLSYRSSEIGFISGLQNKGKITRQTNGIVYRPSSMDYGPNAFTLRQTIADELR